MYCVASNHFDIISWVFCRGLYLNKFSYIIKSCTPLSITAERLALVIRILKVLCSDLGQQTGCLPCQRLLVVLRPTFGKIPPLDTKKKRLRSLLSTSFATLALITVSVATTQCELWHHWYELQGSKFNDAESNNVTELNVYSALFWQFSYFSYCQ